LGRHRLQQRHREHLGPRREHVHVERGHDLPDVAAVAGPEDLVRDAEPGRLALRPAEIARTALFRPDDHRARIRDCLHDVGHRLDKIELALAGHDVADHADERRAGGSVQFGANARPFTLRNVSREARIIHKAVDRLDLAGRQQVMRRCQRRVASETEITRS
jgi:hypothetical protein